MRNSVGFMCDYPTTLINVQKMVGYVDLKDIFQNGLKYSKNFCLLYDI